MTNAPLDECLLKYRERLTILENSLPNQIDPIGISRTTLPFKVLNYRETLIWRVAELARTRAKSKFDVSTSGKNCTCTNASQFQKRSFEDARRAIRSRRWFEGVPLLVIEVISPSERKTRRLQKIGLYLDLGVPNVLEVDYTKRLLRLHTQDAHSAAVYRQGDRLTAPFHTPSTKSSPYLIN